MVTTPAEGQIWKDNDPRKERLVYILSVNGGWVKIFSCNEVGDRVKGARHTHVAEADFGKRFTLHTHLVL